MLPWSCRSFNKESYNQWMTRITMSRESKVYFRNLRTRQLNISLSLTKCMTITVPKPLKTSNSVSKPDNTNQSFLVCLHPREKPANKASNFTSKTNRCFALSAANLAKQTMMINATINTIDMSVAMSITAQAILSTLHHNLRAVCKNNGHCNLELIQLRRLALMRVMVSMRANGRMMGLGRTGPLVMVKEGIKRI